MTILLALFLWVNSGFAAEEGPTAEEWIFIQNEDLRLGVLRSSGAGIAFLAPASGGANVLNHFDQGRLVQQSYYGDLDGSFWVDKPWCYNPVQGGEYKGTGGQILEIKSDGNVLYSRSKPRNWASGELLSECTMEQWVSLEGPLVHIRFAFRYEGQKSHKPHHQEIPAVFLNSRYSRLAIFEGENAWADGPVTVRVPGSKNEYHKIPEHWAAYLDESGNGFGILVPAANELTCYTYPGTKDVACSYLAPLTTFAILPGRNFKYEAWLTLGSAKEIRDRFRKLKELPISSVGAVENQ